MKSALVLFALTVAVAACGGGPAATPARPSGGPATGAPATSVASTAPGSGSADLPSGEELCALLTPNDWATLTFTNATAPTVNSDAPGSAYCVYAGDSGAEGGLEFDSFVDATAADAEDTFNTIADELPGGQPVDMPGADAVLVNPDVDGTFGAIVVRSGRFTYTITVPTSDGAQSQLEALAALVLTRADSYR